MNDEMLWFWWFDGGSVRFGYFQKGLLNLLKSLSLFAERSINPPLISKNISHLHYEIPPPSLICISASLIKSLQWSRRRRGFFICISVSLVKSLQRSRQRRGFFHAFRLPQQIPPAIQAAKRVLPCRRPTSFKVSIHEGLKLGGMDVPLPFLFFSSFPHFSHHHPTSGRLLFSFPLASRLSPMVMWVAVHMGVKAHF